MKAQEEIAAFGHTEVVDEAVAATCTTTGLTEGLHCSVCGEVLKAQAEIAALGHIEVVDEAVAATCTTAGLTKGSHCSRCGEIFVAQQDVSATSHTEVVDFGVAATCTETGLTEGSHCSVCGVMLKDQDIIPATGHSEVVEAGIDATCTTAGVTERRYCSVCGEVLQEKEAVPALGHLFGPWKVRTAATMTRTGVKVRNCTRCDKEETATIAKLATPYVKLDKTKFVYNAKVQRPKVMYVKIGTVTLSPTYYKVTYRNDKLVGIGTVMVQGLGKYSAYSKSLNYTIIPRRAAIASLKSTKAGTALIGWNKVYGGITGYQIQYATNSKFTGGKAVLVASPTKLSRGLSGLASKKTYYFRIRAYKKVGTKTVFGAWSYVKKCVVK